MRERERERERDRETERLIVTFMILSKGIQYNLLKSSFKRQLKASIKTAVGLLTDIALELQVC